MIVTSKNLKEVVNLLLTKERLSLDTETTGLRFDQGGEIFSIIFADEAETYYFNFKDYGDGTFFFERGDGTTASRHLGRLLGSDILFFLHNAKFDMRALASFGFPVPKNVHCTQALARVEFNTHLKYSLDECAKRIGHAKSNEVEEFIKKHHLWKWEIIPGKAKRNKRKFFDRVPFEIISAYAQTDARVTYVLGLHQEKVFSDLNGANNKSSLTGVIENEKRFTQTCFTIERTGIRIDRDYCERTIRFEDERCGRLTGEFEKLTGLQFIDSEKQFVKVFTKVLEKLPRTEKGNISFDDAAIQLAAKLEPAYARIAELILEQRDAVKKANTYYRNFIYWADKDDVLHPNIMQSGTATGRVSVLDPALQTIPKKEESSDSSIQVRRSFIPRKDFFFFEMDYKAMEFRMLVDYAGERELAEEIKNGFDPHEATAKLVGVSRSVAKTISFGLLYGMGVAKLARSLGVDEDTARKYKYRYFRALPKVRALIYYIKEVAEKRGYIKNWLKRRSQFPDPKWAYKGINYLIQGGCADLVKVAMNKMHDFLKDHKSRMVLQIHDAVLFEIHESELFVIPALKKIMEEVYPAKYLPMGVSSEYSFTSWGDLKSGVPSEQEARDHFQGEGNCGSKEDPKHLGDEHPTGLHSGDTGSFSLRQGEVCGA